MSDAAFLTAMVDVENAWLTALVDTGIAPAAAAFGSDRGGIGCRCRRDRQTRRGRRQPRRSVSSRCCGTAPAAKTARWLHRGLTSQDVVDTALMLCLRDVLSRIGDELTAQVRTLVALTEVHQHFPVLARTLTQAALPSTVGAKIADWLTGVLDAADTVAALPPLTVQTGGAAGTHAAATELTGSPDGALAPVRRVGRRPSASRWPRRGTRRGRRSPEPAMPGRLLRRMGAHRRTTSRRAAGPRSASSPRAAAVGSSTMPHKTNPVLSMLIRRAALTAPALGATLHAASAASVDERSDGGWHAEWATLRTLTQAHRRRGRRRQPTCSTACTIDADRAGAISLPRAIFSPNSGRWPN